jgi:neutral ceramidase
MLLRMLRLPLPLLLALACFAPAAHGLVAGAARVEITPPAGVPLNGYGARLGRNSAGKHDPLWARCLYLDDGETRLYLVTLDLVAVNPELRDRIHELAPDNVPKEHIILTATHTHTGHGAMCRSLLMRPVSGRFIPEVLEATARGVAQAMQDAWNSRRRAAIGYGTTKQQSLSRNRRYTDGPIDPQIGVITVEDADGSALAIVTNFAAHPTSIDGPDSYFFSADYPGFYYSEIERLAEPGCVALFLNGAQGNQTIGNPEDKSGWARTESVGRLLAVMAKGVSNKTICGEAKLHIGWSRPALPRTLAAFQPDSVFLQTLEINDLLLAFVPGEACVEIGLELRRLALDRGYGAQFTVGLANDYLMYFIPAKFYAHLNYESGANFFGPLIEDWFYRQFTALMTRGDPLSAPETPEPAMPEEVENGLRIVIEGGARARGWQRGRAFANDIREKFETRIMQPVREGSLLPDTGLMSMAPAFMDLSPIAAPLMAMASRPLLDGVSADCFAFLEGMADGADLPFDAVWLLQHADAFHQRKNRDALFAAPLCTMFAALGDRAGADRLIIGRNLDWPHDEMPVIIEHRPEEGHAILEAGFAWNAGIFTGMNDAGLCGAIQRFPGGAAGGSALPDPALGGPAPEFVLREALRTADDVASAMELFRGLDHVYGVHVLLAGPGEDGPEAVMIALNGGFSTWRAEAGLLFGLQPETAYAGDAARARYGRARDLLADERIIGARETGTVLSDEAPGRRGRARIWNEWTRHSVIMLPEKRIMRVAFPEGGGRLGAWMEYSLRAGNAPAEEQTDE